MEIWPAWAMPEVQDPAPGCVINHWNSRPQVVIETK